MPSDSKKYGIYAALRMNFDDIEGFAIPIARIIIEIGFKERHFRAVSELTGLEFDFSSETATFGDFIEALLKKEEDYG